MYQLFFILTTIGFAAALYSVFKITRKVKKVSVNYCSRADELLQTNFFYD